MTQSRPTHSSEGSAVAQNGSADVLALIPARGGSKGLPGKNIRLLGGEPLVVRSLRFAQALGLEPMLSTDSESIAKACADHGFPTSYRRPARLSGDDARVEDAALDALSWAELSKARRFRAVLLLQPTSPFRDPVTLRAAIKRFTTEGLDSLVSVAPSVEPPWWAIDIRDDGWGLAGGGKLASRRQDYGETFFLDGNFYIASADWLRAGNSFVEIGRTELFVHSSVPTVDINDARDFDLAETLFAGGRSLGKRWATTYGSSPVERS